MAPDMQTPALSGTGVRESDLAGQRVDREYTDARKRTQQDADFALDLIRGASRDLKAIDQHVTTAGTALSQGRLSWRDAIKRVNYYAPGIIPVECLALLDGGSQ